MARGPFQGTWQTGVRPTVVTAPDAIVYINGEPDMISCGQCRRRFDINKYITSIQVDLNTMSAPGSASVNLSIPRHTVDDFFFEGEPIISPMMEIEIYAKGYFLVEGMPQYYPIFWGLVTEVTDNYAGGEHTVNINCADILKWWELCKMNVNPAFTQPAGQVGRNYLVGNLFTGANVYDIIWTLAQQAFGDVVQATGSLTSLIQEQKQRDTFSRSLSDIMGYWNQRFGQMRSNLMLYGTQGNAVRGDVLHDFQRTSQGLVDPKFASKAVRLANGGRNTSQLLFDPDNVNPFRSNLSSAGNPNFWQSEFQTKLEIANACKEAVGFEFYMDVTGDIVFKPPFYNLDILSNKPVSWIQDIDIIDWNLSESEAEVVTQLQMQGSFEGGAMDMGVTADFNTPYTQVIDYHLLRKYGWRTETFNAEYMASTFDMFWTGVDMLDRKNAMRHRATVSIPMRPELRLGFPVYLAPKDQIWYVTGINHNLTFGGRASTSLTLTAKRGKFIAPRGIGEISLTGFKNDAKAKVPNPLDTAAKPTAQQISRTGVFKMKIGEAAEIPRSSLSNETPNDDPYAPLILRHPKTGRVVGYPNVVMAYTKPYQPDDSTISKAMGLDVTGKRKAKQIRKTESGTAKNENLHPVASALVQTPIRDLVDKHLTNRYLFGLTSAGVYSYVYDSSKVIEELVLIQASNISVEGQASAALLGKTAIMRPVSDERGFEVVGQFRYGRGVALRDGSLVLSNGGLDDRATVATQVALSGNLFETLAAQSSGLSVISTRYPNPADAVSKLAPEDLQTGATRNPGTGKVEFSSVNNTFVNSSPVDSMQSKGTPVNVEASQLSRALTLAELRVKEETPSGETTCACLTGRSDLAFINVGYQVHVLTGTAGDTSTQQSSATGTGLSQSRQTQIEVFKEQIAGWQKELEVLESDPARVFEDASGITGAIASLRSQIEVAQTKIETLLMSGPFVSSLDSPISADAFAPNADMVRFRVETFLADLYEALDTPHQEFEKSLRAGGRAIVSREQALQPKDPPPPGPLSPPFSAIGRARGGDPEVLALQASTDLDRAVTGWKRFGDNLQAKPKRAALAGKISDLEAKIHRLNVEEERLLKAQKAGGTIVSPSGSVDKQLATLPGERAKAQQELDKARADLHTLNNEFSP